MKKIAILLPDLPQKSYIKPIEASLGFLARRGYAFDFIDPSDFHSTVDNALFYQAWKDRLQALLPEYDAFFGFSFGGVILQQCLSLFESRNVPIILFSTPSIADEALTNKLNEVITLCKQQQIQAALHALYTWVFYPNALDDKGFAIDNEQEAAERMITGLNRVLATDSTNALNTTAAQFTHFIGEHSNLVKPINLIVPDTSELVIVPGAGMRVLTDNPDFCQQRILDIVA